MRFFALSVLVCSCGGASTSSSETGHAAPQLIGIHHLEQGDATNLDLRADGTFLWTIAGCDYVGGSCGTWTDDGHALTLRSSTGKPLSWSRDGVFPVAIASAVVTKTDRGVATAVTPADGSAVFTQEWTSGLVCELCESGAVGRVGCESPQVHDAVCTW